MKRLNDSRSLLYVLGINVLGFALVALSLGACSPGTKKGDPPSDAWKGQMQEMGQTLVEIYPYVVSSREFNAPENRIKIQESLTKMASLAHSVNKERGKTDLGKKLDKDPYLSVISSTLDREIRLAVEGLKSGKRDFSRVILKNATGMCVRCHSRGQWGPEFVDWQKEASFQRLNPIEKGDLLAAVRHYDQAIQQYEVVLSDKQLAATEAESWVKAGNSALNVAVRSKQDPVVAERIVNTILSNSNLPAYQKTNVEEWKKAILSWKDSKEKKSTLSPLAQAQQILKEARKNEDYWGDRGSYIHYLRASALLHDFLRTESSSFEQAQALNLLGESYEVISEMGEGDANQFYYKACIKRSPHTKVAVGCYRRLEQNLHIEFSGSGDIRMPRMAMDELRVLRDLASPAELDPSSEGKSMFDRQ